MRKKSKIKKRFTYGWIILWAGLSIVVAIAIHFLFKQDAPWLFLEAKWTPGDILTYISTVFLGLLAMWQNQKIVLEQIEQFEFTVRPKIQCYLSCYKTLENTPYLVLVTENIGETIARNITFKVNLPKEIQQSLFYSEIEKLKGTSFTLAPGARLSTPIVWEKYKYTVINSTIEIEGTYKYTSSKGEEMVGNIDVCKLTIKEFDLFNAINVMGGQNGQTENAHAE